MSDQHETAEPPVGSQTDPQSPAREEAPDRAGRPDPAEVAERAEEQVGGDDDGVAPSA